MTYEYKLQATTVGNPDHGQDPNRPMWGAPALVKENIPIPEVTKTLRDWIVRCNVGGGNLNQCYLWRRAVGAKRYSKWLEVYYNGRMFALPAPGGSWRPVSEYVLEDGQLVEYKPVTKETRTEVINKLREKGAKDLSEDTIREAFEGTANNKELIKTALYLVRTREINKWNLE